MPGKRSAVNAFSQEYLALLRERDEPETAADCEQRSPLVLREHQGRFALFRPWQRAENGDLPEALFDLREDALWFLAARGAVSRLRTFSLREGEEQRSEEGFLVEKLGRPAGRLRSYDPDWVASANALVSAARSPEDLAEVLSLAGPQRQEQVGEILGRGARDGGEG
ncbi:MAG: hypothetical protein ACJ75H_00470 [Thermoanaerobaculia bacterium]